jgi:signal transduction histidine kinase
MRRAANDSTKAIALNEIAFAYRYSAPDSLLHYAQMALSLATKASIPSERARALQLIGYAHDNQGKYDMAFEEYTQALEQAKSMKDSLWMAYTLNCLGNLDKRMGRYERALVEFSQALELLRTLRRPAACALMISNIGAVEELQGRFHDALRSQRRAKQVLDSLHHPDVIIASQRLGSLLLRRQEVRKALECFTTILQRSDTAEYKRFVATSLCSMGYIHALAHRHQEARLYTTRGLQVAQGAGSRHELQMNYRLVADAYAALNNAPQALKYYRYSTELKDSLLNDEQQHKIIRLQEQLAAALATSAQTQEIQHLKKSSAEQAVMRNSFLAGFICMFVLAVVALNGYRVKRRSTALLQEQHEEIVQQRDVLAKQSQSIIAMNTTLHSLNAELDAKNSALEKSIAHVNTLNHTLAEANADLHRANQEKNEMLGVVAHDLKNPLASILLGLDSLTRSDSKLAAADRIKRYQALASVADRMNHIINNLLDTKAMESGLASLRLEMFDIRHSITAIVREYADRATSKAIELHWEVPEVAAMVLANEHLVLEILDNLVSNALKYSPRGARVRIDARVHIAYPHLQSWEGAPTGANNGVRVSVHDEGPGLSVEDQKRLFEKFARLSPQPTGGEHSTGLGLSIVKKLTEAMGGCVWCESMQGAGATFFVWLPAEPFSGHTETGVI